MLDADGLVLGCQKIRTYRGEVVGMYVKCAQLYHYASWHHTRGIFHERFSIAIQIRWNIGFSVTALYGIISLQHFANSATAQLSCLEQNLIEITSPTFG